LIRTCRSVTYRNVTYVLTARYVTVRYGTLKIEQSSICYGAAVRAVSSLRYVKIFTYHFGKT